MQCIPDSWYWIPDSLSAELRFQTTVFSWVKDSLNWILPKPRILDPSQSKMSRIPESGQECPTKYWLERVWSTFSNEILVLSKVLPKSDHTHAVFLWERCLISFVIRGQSIYDVAMYTYSSRRSRKQATCLGQMLNLVLLAWCNKKKLILRARMNAKYPWSYSPHQIMHR